MSEPTPKTSKPGAGLSGLKNWWLATFAPELAPASPEHDNVQEVKLREAAGVTIDADEDNWRPLTGDVDRDLSPMTQLRMQKMALYLWESNLLANRLIELPLAYILGEGVKVTVPNEDAQKALDVFWRDPVNQMDLKLPKKIRELSIYGEQFWPTFVNESNGAVRLGYLDPSMVETIVKDPDNGEQPIGIVTVKDRKGRARRYKVIVNGPEDGIFTARTRAIRDTFNNGECFYFAINDLSNGKRGRSDLLAQSDWLDTYEQFMFGEADRSVAMRSFLWDITLKGASPDQVKARAKDITSPKPGSARVHNDSEVWEALAPTLGAADLSGVAQLFRNHILGGGTIPTHWYGGSQDANRAVGESMSEPTVKVLAQRQRVWMHILTFVGQYVIRQRLLKTSQSEPDWFADDMAVVAEFPEIQAKDTTKYAAALQQVTASVVIMIDNGLITKELGLRVIEKVAARLGVEFDAAAELAKAEEELRAKQHDQGFQPLPGEGAQPGDAAPPAAPPAAPVDNAPMRQAVDQLRDRINDLAGDVKLFTRQPLREAAAPAGQPVSVTIAEGAIQIHNVLPAPTSPTKRVTERDEDKLIVESTEVFTYEKKE